MLLRRRHPILALPLIRPRAVRPMRNLPFRVRLLAQALSVPPGGCEEKQSPETGEAALLRYSQ
jgi:hypothetical protein